MFNRLKDEFSLLIGSSRNILLFELFYKMSAVAVIYPVILYVMNWCMRVAGIRYLTNQYIKRVMFNPVVILIVFISIVLFVIYCTYEMAFLSMCFETKRVKFNASIIDVLYNAIIRIRKLYTIRSIPMLLLFFVSILFSNVTVLFNIFWSETTANLFRIYILHGKVSVNVVLVLALICIYVHVILSVYSFNIYMLERKSLIESYKKSIRMVREHLLGTISALIAYNLMIMFFIGLVYIIISVVLIIGVKLLDMAYIGSAVYLSVLRAVRGGVKFFLVLTAIPVSFSAFSHVYYRYADLSGIEADFIDVSEGSGRFNKTLYGVVLGLSLIANTFYVISAFNNNPFERVAIFHETQITAHRGASRLAPENTLAAFTAAIDNLADYIELDVCLTADGYVVVMHDDSAYRTTGVDRNISQMTLMEVRQLDAGSWYSREFAGEKVPTFEEVLELTRGRIKLNVEIKSGYRGLETAKKTVELIEKYNMTDDVVVTSFDYDILKCVKDCNCDIQTGYILSAAYGNFYEMEYVDFFSMNASFLSKRVVDAIHNSGKQVHAWTVNNSTSIRNLTNKGVDNIITDEPVIARETVYSRNTSETMLNMLKYVFNR